MDGEPHKRKKSFVRNEMISKYAIPTDLFEFVRKNQNDINALTYSISDFFRKRHPNPYTVLSCLTNVVTFIVENNFIDVADMEHLELLVNQTVDAYTNSVLEAADNVAYDRFGKSFKDLGALKVNEAANKK